MLFPPLYALLSGPLAAVRMVCSCLCWECKPTRKPSWSKGKLATVVHTACDILMHKTEICFPVQAHPRSSTLLTIEAHMQLAISH